MKISLALLLLTAIPASAHAQGFALAPGEKLVSVNGIPVGQGAIQAYPREVTNTSQLGVAQQSTASNQAPAMSVSLAQSKAQRMASSGRMAHLGGGFGGGRYEGVGMGSTREAAIRNCCYWGQRTPIDIGAATNGGRWFACVIYR